MKTVYSIRISKFLLIREFCNFSPCFFILGEERMALRADIPDFLVGYFDLPLGKNTMAEEPCAVDLPPPPHTQDPPPPTPGQVPSYPPGSPALYGFADREQDFAYLLLYGEKWPCPATLDMQGKPYPRWVFKSRCLSRCIDRHPDCFFDTYKTPV